MNTKEKINMELKNMVETMMNLNREENVLREKEMEMGKFYQQKNELAAKFIKKCLEQGRSVVAETFFYIIEGTEDGFVYVANNEFGDYYDKIRIPLPDGNWFTILPPVIKRYVTKEEYERFCEENVEYCLESVGFDSDGDNIYEVHEQGEFSSVWGDKINSRMEEYNPGILDASTIISADEYAEEPFVDDNGNLRMELETMPYDKTFVTSDGNEELCHATGYAVNFDGFWWTEFMDNNGNHHYGN